MTYELTRGFSAPPEVVFGIATDPARWSRWLPPGMRLERATTDELRLVWSGGAEVVRWHVAPERLNVTAGALAGTWWGSLDVADAPAGGSTARLAVDGDGGPLPGTVEELLARLAEEVAENFNPG